MNPDGAILQIFRHVSVRSKLWSFGGIFSQACAVLVPGGGGLSNFAMCAIVSQCERS